MMLSWWRGEVCFVAKAIFVIDIVVVFSIQALRLCVCIMRESCSIPFFSRKRCFTCFHNISFACFPWNKTHLNPFKSSSSGSSNKWEEFPFSFLSRGKIFNWNHSLCVPLSLSLSSLLLHGMSSPLLLMKRSGRRQGRKRERKFLKKRKRAGKKSCSIICVGSHHPHPNLHHIPLSFSHPSDRTRASCQRHDSRGYTHV